MSRSTVVSDVAPARGAVRRIGAWLEPLSARLRHLGLLPAAVVVALVASINFLGGLGSPPHPIWDESYYLTAVARYEAGIAQFASHPPLGLALITAGDVLLHPNRGLDTRHIGWDKKVSGDELPKRYSFAGVRLMPGIFGAAGAVVFFFLMYVLSQSVFAALALSNLYVFDNALIVHFRAAQLDPFQIAFVLGALLCFAVAARRGGRSAPGLDVLFGVCCGLAMMVKLNAAVLTFLGALLVVRRVAIGWPASASRARVLATGVRDGALMAGGCIAAIAVVATLHVALNRIPPDPASPAGRKDISFMSPAYSDFLHGKRPLSAAVVLAASGDYLDFMFDDLKGVPRTDPNGSRTIDWPFHRGTINYRWDSTGEETAYVQLTGNQVAWLLGLAALLASPVLLLWSRAAPGPASDPARRAIIVMLLAQYFVYMGVHAYIGIERVMYLYHYFIALVMTYCLVPLVLAELADRSPAVRRNQLGILGGMALLIWAAFIFYAPLTFHWYLTVQQCEWRNVLQHVVHCHH